MHIDQQLAPASLSSDLRDVGNNVIEFTSGAGTARIDGDSMMFDPDWYRATYPDTAGVDNVVEHYIRTGWRLGYDPNPFFSTRDYLAANPELGGEKTNPFLHYVLYGARQGRRPRAG